MSTGNSNNVSIQIPAPNSAPYPSQTNTPNSNANQTNWPSATLPNGGVNYQGLAEKEHLALSDLLASTFTASFWNFRSRFERLLLFIVFIVSILCVVLLVLMVLLLVNSSQFNKGKLCLFFHQIFPKIEIKII